MKTESVSETLADLNLMRLLGLADFTAELYAFSLYMTDRQHYFAQPKLWDAHT
jgi:hypothetical protein